MESQEAVAVLDEASLPFEGRWNRLISRTNWEKGQIIYQWRAALKTAEAAATEYSDEAWSLRVSSVTGQHVGRLRRVYERFGEVHDQFEGLYWSHFQAALDWDDAEMWLEGGIQEHWSVSQMRKSRWEALGAPEELKPSDKDLVVAELNEDFESPEHHVPSMVESTINSAEEFYGGNTPISNVVIPVEKMNLFLERSKEDYKILAKEHIKRIQFLKKIS